jgi:predicted permease
MSDRDHTYLWRRYRDLVRRRPAADVDDEVRLHLEYRRQEALRNGADPARADALARERFGDVDGVVAELNAIDGSRERRQQRADWIGDFVQDVKFAVRSLRRTPSFAVTAILTLGLAIGANTTIFSFVNALLLAPLPYKDPGHLVRINASIIGSVGEMLALRERTNVFSEIGLYQNRSIVLNDDRDATRIDGISVTPNLIRMLGIAPAVGSVFDDEAGKPGGGNRILLSHGLWLERYGGDRSIVGRHVVVDGTPYAVVGVMPESFNFPSVGVRFWVPVVIDPSNVVATWAVGGSRFIGRLAPGVTAQRATVQLATVLPGMRKLNPVWDPGDQYGTEAVAQPLRESLVRSERPALILLMACVGVVLLVACVNIANLMMARVTAREREFAVRAALGGGRGRLIRQLVTESVVTAAIGGGLGIALAFAGVRWGVASLPGSIRRTADIHINGAVLLFTAVLVLVTGLAFGLLPAWRASSDGSADAMRSSRGAIGGRAHQRASSALVTIEVALAVLLAIVAGLLTRSFDELRSLSPGFRTEHVVSAQISPPAASYGRNNAERTNAFYETLMRQASALPRVTSVGIVDRLPIAGPVYGMGVRIEGQFEDGTRLLPSADHLQTITPGYLAAMGIPVVRGRAFDANDRAGAPPVALVSQAFARRFWPDADPIGKRIGYPQQSPWLTVVGIVPDMKLDSLRDTSAVAVLVPFAQRPAYATPAMFIVVRSNADVGVIARQLRETVASIDRTVPVTSVRTMSGVLAQSVERPRFTTSLVVGFALAALVLGATGIYGVMSYIVNQRAQEMGVRMALGATPRDIVRLVVGRGAALAVGGAIVGCVVALLTTRLLQSLLFGVSATDPLTFTVSVTVFVGVAILASAGPARRATRADPVQALRGL